MIRIGYACVNTELPTAARSLRLAHYSEEKMLDIARSNICALERILHWNIHHRIHLFRITSGLIPFGSHPVNSGSWVHMFRGDFQRIGGFIRENAIRVSMHPGQYTVLNTPDEDTFGSSMRDLDYHNTVLALMGLDSSHKIIIHGGGAYREKEKFRTLLEERIRGLPQALGNRLALENDERVFNAEDILILCRDTGLPGILDVFHHSVLPSFSGISIRDLILLFGQTWSGQRQKIHYSDQDPAKRKGSHSQSVHVAGFGHFLETVRDLEMDIMLEVKDKQASVLALRHAYPDLE